MFYRQPSDAKPTYWEKLRDEKGCLAVEMESFALFHNAKVLGKRAACLLTISDSFVSPEDHNRRTAPDQLYRNDEGGPGRGRLFGEVIWKKQRPQSLIRDAFEAQKFAYVPYSRFHVGAALLAQKRQGLHRLQHRKRRLHPHQLCRAHRPVQGGQRG